ncbi:hypothetical protein [Streptomyces phaeoluteigriseus]|uniref:hypothetical protein n=1 Tax=Streptomyces phaeoluteigriseus TaxID=114686 RepID=UPI0036A4FF89
MLAPPAIGDSRLSFWLRVREFAVPPSMIETATARRLAGDWAGACAAAGFDVDLNLRSLARSHHPELAARIRADLRCLAPDLLRWHMPRIAPDGLLRPGLTLTLARYDALGQDGVSPVHLVVRTPPAWADSGQRISLTLWDGSGADYGADACRHPHPRPSRRFRFDLHRHLWDASRADELRGRSGADGPAPDLHPAVPAAVPDGYRCAVGRWAAEAEILLRAERRPPGPVLVRCGGRHRLVLDVRKDAAAPGSAAGVVPEVGGSTSAWPVSGEAGGSTSALPVSGEAGGSTSALPVSGEAGGSTSALPVSGKVGGSTSALPFRHEAAGGGATLSLLREVGGATSTPPVRGEVGGAMSAVPVWHGVGGATSEPPVRHEVGGATSASPVRHEVSAATSGRPVPWKVSGSASAWPLLYEVSGSMSELPVLPDAATWVPPDLELIRAGAIDIGRLHPLVASALVPGHVPAGPGRRPDPAGRPRLVECRGARHRIGLVDGVLAPLDHAPEEIRREELLVALTGTPLPCLQAIDEAHRHPDCLTGVRERLVHGDIAGALAVVEGLLGPGALLRDGALRDALEAAARQRITYGLYRAGLTGPARTRAEDVRRPRVGRSRPRHGTSR